jgi:hypothetical protein
MKTILIKIVIVCVVSNSIAYCEDTAIQKSANEVAKRVIADIAEPFLEYHPVIASEKRRLQGVGSSHEDFQLAEGGVHSRDLLRSYMLSNAASEKVRVAYAITVLAHKRQPLPSKGGILINGGDPVKNEQYLKDGLFLLARLAEIEKAEQAAPRNR